MQIKLKLFKNIVLYLVLLKEYNSKREVNENE